MTERREDPYTGRSVLIAPARRGLGGKKPGGLPESQERCPFCPGHEADTETTVARWPAEPDAWRVRVVRNKYPVVAEGFEGARGIHDVVIDAPEHDADLADFSSAHMVGLLGVYRARVRALESDPTTGAVMLFRNRGRRAGSSQPHPHTQIAATAWVPSEVGLRWERARRHRRDTGEGLHEAELRRELSSTRVIRVDPTLASYAPFAPSRPFEVRFSPRLPEGGFGEASDVTLAALAEHLLFASRRLRERTSIRDYNLVLRQPPVSRGERGDHGARTWHLELLPRTGGDAGYELSGGEMIVVVPPEDAAAHLRDD